MIIINSGKMNIPEQERFIGFAGDNLHIQRQFYMDNVYDDNAIYRLYLTFDDGTTNFLALDSEKTDDSTLLTWTVQTDHIFKSGIVTVQIKAFCSDDEVYHTTSDYFIVGDSAEFSDYFSNKENSEFLEYENALNEIADYIKNNGSISGLVPDTRTVAGIALENNITVPALKNALGIQDILHGTTEPTPSTQGIYGQLYIKTSDPRTLYMCTGQREGYTFWSQISNEETDLTGLVLAIRTIAGIDLTDDITADELRAALQNIKRGTIEPTSATQGLLGQVYYNQISQKAYVCVSNSNNSYIWVQISGNDTDLSNCESLSNKVTSISDEPNNSNYPSEKAVSDFGNNIFSILTAMINQKQGVSGRVSSIDENSTDTQYPTAKAVYSFVTGTVGDLESAVDSIIAIQNSTLGG